MMNVLGFFFSFVYWIFLKRKSSFIHIVLNLYDFLSLKNFGKQRVLVPTECQWELKLFCYQHSSGYHVLCSAEESHTGMEEHESVLLFIYLFIFEIAVKNMTLLFLNVILTDVNCHADFLFMVLCLCSLSGVWFGAGRLSLFPELEHQGNGPSAAVT